MKTLAQRKRLRKEHGELTKKIILQEKVQEEIKALGDEVRLKLLNGEPIAFAIRVCDSCGFRAYTEKDLEHFYKGNSCHKEVTVCKCCGKSSRFSTYKHKVCTDCLGQSIEGTSIPEWSQTPIAFTLRFPDGNTQSFSSVSEASKLLGMPQSSLQNLVIGFWSHYKGIVAEVTPNIRTYDDLKALRASKSLR